MSDRLSTLLLFIPKPTLFTIDIWIIQKKILNIFYTRIPFQVSTINSNRFKNGEIKNIVKLF